MSRGRQCVIVDVDGEQVRGQFDRTPTEEDLEAFRNIVRAMHAKLDEVPKHEGIEVLPPEEGTDGGDPAVPAEPAEVAPPPAPAVTPAPVIPRPVVSTSWPIPEPPSAEERSILRRVGVPEPDAGNPLHRDVLDVVRRMRNAPEGTRNVALSYAWLAELDRQGRAHAIAKSRYERLLAREIIRLRQSGIEKSGTAAEKRAEDNDDVWQAHLDYRLAERLEWVAKSALRVLEVANDNWRTIQANERAADASHARTGT